MPATRESPDEFRRVIDINLNGCYWMAQACGRVMQSGSSIINVLSAGLTTAGLPQAAYASSKAGLIGLTRDLAAQWSGRKASGSTQSRQGSSSPDDRADAPGYIESQMERIPLARKGDPRELRGHGRLLASPAAGYIVGQRCRGRRRTIG